MGANSLLKKGDRHLRGSVFPQFVEYPRGASPLFQQVAKRRCAAFSLLEVILALTLATVLIGLLLLATRTFLQVGEETKHEVERATLARNVLQLIARDLQNIVVPAAQDVSGLSTAPLPDADELAEAAAAAGGTGGGSSTGGNSSGGGGNSSSGASQGRGGASGTGGNSGGSTSNGAGGNQNGNSGASGGNSSGGNSSSGSSSGGNSSGSGASGDTSDSGDGGESSSSTSAEVTDANSLDVPGVYGNRYELAFDILRTPEYNPYAASANGSSAAPQRVSWSVIANGNVAGTSPDNGNSVGLVRSSLARAAASWANSNGQTQGSGATAPLSSRVAAIEFRYFDGSQWVDTWDSAQQEALPVAIEAAVLVLSRAEASSDDVEQSLAGTAGSSAMFAGSIDGDVSSTPGKIYRRVIYLPLSGLSPTAAAEAAANAEDSSADAVNDSGSDAIGSDAGSGSGSGTGGTR